MDAPDQSRAANPADAANPPAEAKPPAKKTATKKTAAPKSPPEGVGVGPDGADPAAMASAAQPPSEPPPSITVALAHVMADVRAVGKGSQAPGNLGGFMFRGVDAVVNAVGPVLRTHGVVVMPEVLHVERVTTQSRNGASMLNVYVTTRFTFHGPAGDSLSCTVLGEAADAGDKATAKAQSVAYRVALLQALCLPTTDPDPDSEGYERERQGQRQGAQQGARQDQATGTQEVTYTAKQVQVNEAIGRLTPDEMATLTAWATENQVPAIRNLSDTRAGNLLEYLEWLVGQRSKAAEDPNPGAPWDETTPHDAAPPS